MIINFDGDFFEPDDKKVGQAILWLMELDGEELNVDVKKKIADFVEEYCDLTNFEDELREYFQEDADRYFQTCIENRKEYYKNKFGFN